MLQAYTEAFQAMNFDSLLPLYISSGVFETEPAFAATWQNNASSVNSHKELLLAGADLAPAALRAEGCSGLSGAGQGNKVCWLGREQLQLLGGRNTEGWWACLTTAPSSYAEKRPVLAYTTSLSCQTQSLGDFVRTLQGVQQAVHTLVSASGPGAIMRCLYI